MRAILAGVGTLVFAACVDPDAEFEDFAERWSESPLADAAPPPPVDGGACTPPEIGESAEVLLVVSVNLGPSTPLLFRGEARIVDAAGRRALELDLAPLGTDRRTPAAQSESYGPFAVAQDGSLIIQLDRREFPGEANPISGSPIEIQASLPGTLCAGQTLNCGTLTGELFEPLQIDVTGTYTLLWLEDPAEIPEPPPINCAADPAAPLGA